MTEIVPAILPKSLDEIAVSLASLKGAASLVQLDVVDGAYAANLTWPYVPGGKEEFARIAGGDEGLPFWEDFDFEFDLMLKSAMDALAYVSLGASRVVIHADSDDALATLRALQQFRNEGSAFPIEVGVALRVTDEPRALKEFDGLFDYVQVMGIEKVGFQRQPFDERALTLLRMVRAAYPSITLQVDGGVRPDNAPALRDAGAMRLVAGSSVVNAEDPRAAIRLLQGK